jgi:GTP pyrophosphokinase
MEVGLECEIKGRVKAISSIYRKMQKQQIPLEEVYDLFAIRIIIDSANRSEAQQKADCWKAYNVVTSLYKPHPSRLRDWISVPKATGYQSLHTTVMGQEGQWVEVQIRTREMDAAAEKGIAAHWKYKAGQVDQTENKLETWLLKVRELLEQKHLNAKDFVKEVRDSLVLEEIYLFTPKGDIKVLPAGSSILDFAYLIHSNIGNRCIGAKVNQKLVGLGHKLRNGDQVEVLTSQKQWPQQDWLQFTTTPRAQQKVKEALRERYKEIASKGKEIFDWRARQLNVHENHQAVRELLAEFNIPNIYELYYRIGNHQIDVRRLAEFIKRKAEKRSVYDEHPTVEAYAQYQQEEFDRFLERVVGVDSDRLMVKGEVDTGEYRLAECCHPIPGDEIIGFYDPDHGITIHRTNCNEARERLTAQGQSIVKVNWAQDDYIEFLTGIRVVGQDVRGMMMKMLRVISLQHRINIRSITIDTKNGAFEGLFKLYVHNTHDVDRLIDNLLKIKGVHGATRLR